MKFIRAYENILDDLASVRVIYLGEYHTVQRHHDMQKRILTDLAQRGKSLVLGLEQLRQIDRPIADYLHVTALKKEPEPQ
jgi:uncharacterized iron-regulated protein